MKRILVISDNPNLAQALFEQIKLNSLQKTASFVYRYSSVNRLPQAMIDLGYTAIDIKNADTVEWAIESFDLILSIHCKQIFPAKLVDNVCCINVHPGLNPYNRGWYPQVFSIINKMPIGATIHIMNQHVDAGDIIAQQKVEISSFDTSLTLYEKVQVAEISLLREHINSIVSGKFKAETVACVGNYNSVSDFNQLCCLDLESTGTLQSHLDLLRALSHGQFKNAYFLDEEGQKIYVSVQLTPATKEVES